jgi:hypothetical protein
MKKEDKKLLINALGKGCREVYLEENPHGFRKINENNYYHCYNCITLQL